LAKNPNIGASSSAAKKKPPPKKERNRPYMNVAMAQSLFDQKHYVGVDDVHLPDGWHLNIKRMSFPLVPLHGRERRDEICRCRAILPQDLR
jgi:hypothetical protein